MRLAIVPVAGTRRGLLPRVFTLTFLRGAGYWLWVMEIGRGCYTQC